MELSKLFQNKQELSTWIAFKDDFEIDLLYTDRRAMQQMLERSTERGYDKKTHLPTEKMSDERFNEELADRIKGWRGLTLGLLASLTNIELADANPETEVPYTEANARALVGEIYGMNNFIRETITELQVFRENELETERKNSKTSQDSN